MFSIVDQMLILFFRHLVCKNRYKDVTADERLSWLFVMKHQEKACQELRQLRLSTKIIDPGKRHANFQLVSNLFKSRSICAYDTVRLNFCSLVLNMYPQLSTR